MEEMDLSELIGKEWFYSTKSWQQAQLKILYFPDLLLVWLRIQDGMDSIKLKLKTWFQEKEKVVNGWKDASHQKVSRSSANHIKQVKRAVISTIHHMELVVIFSYKLMDVRWFNLIQIARQIAKCLQVILTRNKMMKGPHRQEELRVFA